MLEGYVNLMDEYERLNHMTEVQLSSVPRNHYFIPHKRSSKRHFPREVNTLYD